MKIIWSNLPTFHLTTNSLTHSLTEMILLRIKTSPHQQKQSGGRCDVEVEEEEKK